MTLISQIFDIYIDLNITLCVAFVFWLVAKHVVARVTADYSAQLALINGLFVAVALSPVLIYIHRQLLLQGVLPPSLSVNLTDMAVSQYLQGGIAMPPSEFESLLGTRTVLTEDILGFRTGFGQVVAFALAAGFLVGSVRLMIGAARLSRVIRASHSWRRIGRIELRLSDTAAVPFSTRGLTRYYIVLPSDLLTRSDDLELVLRHELQHVRQSDINWELFLEFIRPLFFWNPAFYFWKHEVENLRELACDQKIAESGKVNLKAYCLCLIRAAEHAVARRKASTDLAMVALIDMQPRWFRRRPGTKLLRRVDALMRPKARKLPFVCNLMIALAIAVPTVTTAVSIQKTGDWSQDRLMLSAIVNLERMRANATSTFGRP